jgi:hypothetical protein
MRWIPLSPSFRLPSLKVQVTTLKPCLEVASLPLVRASSKAGPSHLPLRASLGRHRNAGHALPPVVEGGFGLTGPSLSAIAYCAGINPPSQRR